MLRMTTAAVAIPVLVAAVWFGSYWFSLIVAVFAAIGALEFCRMAQKRGVEVEVTVAIIWSVALVVVGYILSGGLSDVTYLKVLVAIVAFSYLAWQVRFTNANVGLTGWIATASAALYTGGLLFHAPMLRGLDQGREWVFLAVFVTFACDTTALIVGGIIGKRLLAPVVSPNKTVEGAIGGFLAATLSGFILSRLLNLDIILQMAILLGALMGVAGQLGDLFESWIKRKSDVKDSGWIVLGHGGVLDRMDSIVFNLVLVYYFVLWVV